MGGTRGRQNWGVPHAKHPLWKRVALHRVHARSETGERKLHCKEDRKGFSKSQVRRQKVGNYSKSNEKQCVETHHN